MLLVVATLVGSLTMGTASPAGAAPSVGAPTLSLGAVVYERGGASGSATVSVPTTEGANFDLSVSAPGMTGRLPSTCTATGGATCAITAGSVTIGYDGDTTPEEAVTASFIAVLDANRSVGLTSTEGATPPSMPSTVTASVSPTGATTGGSSAATAVAIITADSVTTPTEAEIRLSTTSPSGAPAVGRGTGSTVTYTASLTRFGNLNQQTLAMVDLVADLAMGTTVSPGTQSVLFREGEGAVAKSVSFTVDVPASATPGTATYHFVATYDPTGTDGAPVDTETGTATSFQIVNPPPSVGAPSVDAGSFVERGTSGSVTVTVPATESAEFDLSVTAPGITVTPPDTCTTNTGATCTIAGGDVTISNDGDAIDIEPLTATFAAGLAGTAADLFSTEGASPPSGTARVTAAVTPEGSSIGGLQSATGIANLRADSVTTPTEAEIRLRTVAPTGTPTVNRGGTLTYSAEITRVGDLSQATKVAVDLSADNAQGTSAILGHGGSACAAPNSSCRLITFMPGEGANAKTVSFIVDVPAGATLGIATYRFVGTYDPTGTNGGPTDTEIGNPASFQVAGAAPTPTTSPAVAPAPTTAPATTTPTTAAPAPTTPTTAAPAPTTTTAPSGTTPTTVGPETTTTTQEVGRTAETSSRLPSIDLARVEGGDRIATSLAVSQEAFPRPQSANAVLLARSDDFADALAGTPLAVDRDAPLLLTESADLNPSVAIELHRVLSPGGTVIMLGGSKALSDETESAIKALGFNTQRFFGTDRYATAVAIARDGLANPQTLLLTTGLDFPDAVVAGAAAAAEGGAVLLTADAALPEATQAYIAERAGATRYAIGGPAAQADPPATPLVGEDRYGTAVAVADEFFDNPRVAGVAAGDNFPDALAGGVFMGRLGGPMLLTTPEALPDATHQWLRANIIELDDVYLFGGLLVVSDPVEDAIRAAVRR